MCERTEPETLRLGPRHGVTCHLYSGHRVDVPLLKPRLVDVPEVVGERARRVRTTRSCWRCGD